MAQLDARISEAKPETTPMAYSLAGNSGECTPRIISRILVPPSAWLDVERYLGFWVEVLPADQTFPSTLRQYSIYVLHSAHELSRVLVAPVSEYLGFLAPKDENSSPIKSCLIWSPSFPTGPYVLKFTVGYYENGISTIVNSTFSCKSWRRLHIQVPPSMSSKKGTRL